MAKKKSTSKKVAKKNTRKKTAKNVMKKTTKKAAKQAAKKASKRSKKKTRVSRVKKPNARLLKRADMIYEILMEMYPDAHCALDHRNAWELIIATILSAQCTDERVNMVTPHLFDAYPDAHALGAAKQEDVEKLVKSTGFFRQKAKSIIASSKDISEKHDGIPPADMEELLKLRGVARKTANVVLGNAYNINEGVVVDTHVKRLSYRLGFTDKTDPVKIEPELMALFDRERWTMLSHLLIFHGRQICDARKPKCDECRLRSDCPQLSVK